MSSGRIDKLRTAIETTHRCTARHVESTPVVERLRGGVLGDGVVETFELAGHPQATRCYAWSYEAIGETWFVTVLELPPVDSAATAVKWAIAGEREKIARVRRVLASMVAGILTFALLVTGSVMTSHDWWHDGADTLVARWFSTLWEWSYLLAHAEGATGWASRGIVVALPIVAYTVVFYMLFSAVAVFRSSRAAESWKKLTGRTEHMTP